MKIDKKKTDDRVRFDTILQGSCFKFNDKRYMRVTNIYREAYHEGTTNSVRYHEVNTNAVDIESGELAYFENNEMVYPVDGYFKEN